MRAYLILCNQKKSPHLINCCKFLINFSVCLLKNLIFCIYVKMEHENYFKSSIFIFRIWDGGI